MQILCVGAHPDDEVLGAGATLAKHVADGDTVDVVLLSDGAMARYEEETEAAKRRRAERRAEARAASEVLGVSNLTILDYWGNQFDAEPLIDIVRDLEAVLETTEPDVIYTHSYGDLNVDHQLTARAVRTAARPKADSGVDQVLSYETLSSSEWGMPTATKTFQPTVFVDIESQLDTKVEALEQYASEMRDPPHPRSLDTIRNNARVWGEKFGLRAAEPFELLLDRRR